MADARGSQDEGSLVCWGFEQWQQGLWCCCCLTLKTQNLVQVIGKIKEYSRVTILNVPNQKYCLQIPLNSLVKKLQSFVVFWVWRQKVKFEVKVALILLIKVEDFVSNNWKIHPFSNERLTTNPSFGGVPFFLIFCPFQIEYEIDDIQLSYLQLLSNHAQQVFTFRCKNSVAWYDQSARSFKRAVKFEGASGHEFSSKSKSKKAMIKVPHDGCQVTLLIAQLITW